jgi:hypothetical protein
MTEARGSRRLGRSIVAILTGIITGVALSIGSDLGIHVFSYLPPLGERASDGSLAVATVYRTVWGILGSYLTARLAPYRPMLHAMVLGTLGLVASAAGAIATWNKGPAFGPHGYPVALIVLAIPTAWTGGRWRELQILKATISADG